jgi:hypothetical protein
LTNTTEHKPKPVAAEAPHAKTKSKGEKFFDRAVYGGLAGVGTFFATLALAFQIKHGRWSQGIYADAIRGSQRFLSRWASDEASKKFAKEAVETTTLMMGGNLMLMPVGWAEKHKVKIVEALNTALDDPTPPEVIKEAPPQTWGSLAKARGVAWTIVFVTLFGSSMLLEKSFEMFKHEVGERFYQMARWFKRLPKLPQAEIDRTIRESSSYRVGRLAALDIFATAAAATLLYIGGHFFARKREEKLEHKQDAINLAESKVRHINGAVSEHEATLDQPSAPSSRLDSGSIYLQGSVSPSLDKSRLL